jgi:hypothetical protein
MPVLWRSRGSVAVVEQCTTAGACGVVVLLIDACMCTRVQAISSSKMPEMSLGRVQLDLDSVKLVDYTIDTVRPVFHGRLHLCQ